MKYRWKTRPYHHQVAAVKFLLSTGFGGALLMEPRTGKTKTVIDYASILHARGKVNRVLVICPVSVMGVWLEEFEAHCQFPHTVTIWDKKGRKKLPLPEGPGLNVLVVNYEAFANHRKIGRRAAGLVLRDNLLDWAPDLMVCDESHRLKRPSGRASSRIVAMGPSIPYRVIMTGTAVTKKKRIFDLYMQWKFLNPERFARWDTAKDFKNYFGKWTERNGYPQWLRNQNEEELRELVHMDSFAITRAECYDLPPRRDQIIPVTLEESRTLYDDLADTAISYLNDKEFTWASIPLTLRLRLAMATSGIATAEPTPKHPKGRLVRVGREKQRVLKELLSDLGEAEEKVVVAARFKADHRAIEQVCDQLKIPWRGIYGGISRTQRDEARRWFKAVKSPAVLVIHPKAASLGIDLSSAAVMIWYSLTDSFVDWDQACDRIALSRRETTFMYLMVEGSVDEVTFKALHEDQEISRIVNKAPESLRIT